MKQYTLRWKYSDVRPLCACGCGGKTDWNVALKDFTRYVHGHHALGRKKSDDEKRRIGEKNGENMKRYMREHPDVAKQRGATLSSGLTEQSSERRSQSVKKFWSADSDETKRCRKGASERAIKLLELGKIGPHVPYKTCRVLNPFTGQQELMHSSWEMAFLNKCIEDAYPVTKAHDLRIPYVAHDGSEHTYVPDFVAINERVVFEVKGLLRENDDLKLEALRRWAEREVFRVVLIDHKV